MALLPYTEIVTNVFLLEVRVRTGYFGPRPLWLSCCAYICSCIDVLQDREVGQPRSVPIPHRGMIYDLETEFGRWPSSKPGLEVTRFLRLFQLILNEQKSQPMGDPTS